MSAFLAHPGVLEEDFNPDTVKSFESTVKINYNFLLYQLRSKTLAEYYVHRLERYHLSKEKLDSTLKDPNIFGIDEPIRVGGISEEVAKSFDSHAMLVQGFQKGGIDLSKVKDVLQNQSSGIAMKFHIDPAKLTQFQNALGFTVDMASMTIEPLKSLSKFLGIAEQITTPLL